MCFLIKQCMPRKIALFKCSLFSNCPIFAYIINFSTDDYTFGTLGCYRPTYGLKHNVQFTKVTFI